MAQESQGATGKGAAAADTVEALVGLDIAATADVVDLDLLIDSLGARSDNADLPAPPPLEAALDQVGPAPAPQGPFQAALDTLSDDPALDAAKAQITPDES